jgi:hypothetical protein
MAPQPLSRRYSFATVAIGQSVTIDARRDLALLATRCIAAFSELDSTMANALASMLGATTDADVALAMYHSIQSAGVRSAVVEAAKVASIKDPTEVSLFDQTLKTAKTVAGRRNIFAHHIWAHLPDHDDVILFIDPVAMHDNWRSIQKLGSGGKFGPPPTPPALDRTRIFTFTNNDLQKIIAEILEAQIAAHALLAMLMNQGKRREIERDWLSQWLQRRGSAHRGQKKTKSAQ